MIFSSHFFIFLTAVGLVYTNSVQTSAPSCNDVSKTNIGKLKNVLFCGYDPSVRPVIHHSNKTTIKMAAYPTRIAYLMEEENYAWMGFFILLEWEDNFLTWNPADYDGISEFNVDGSKIWVPDIIVIDPTQTQFIQKANCAVHFNGSIFCSLNTGLYAQCKIDLTYFPFDRHACRIVFRPPLYKDSVIDFQYLNISVSDPYKFYGSHGAWNIVAYMVNCIFTSIITKDDTVDMAYTFVVERRGSTYRVTYATPALVMMAMVLSVFWLDVQSSARIILPGLAVLGHLMIMHWLMQAIHTNFEYLPVIIVLFRDSLLMTGLALVWSVAARSLCSSSSPYWLYMASINLNNSQLVKLLLPQDIFIQSGTSRDEPSLTVQRDCVEKQWQILTTLCDRLLFGLYILTYIVFFMRLTP